MDPVNGHVLVAAGVTPSGALPNIPWEDRPADSSAVMWRSSRNPIIKRDELARSNSIFNSAVVPFGTAMPASFEWTTPLAR